MKRFILLLLSFFILSACAPKDPVPPVDYSKITPPVDLAKPDREPSI